MKLNNKGLSLIELLITLVFVGMIVVLMFSLLNELKDETDRNDFAYNNQVNKIDAIHTIEKDLNNYTLLGIKRDNSNSLLLYFDFEKNEQINTAVLSITNNNNKYYLNYKNVDNDEYSWEMKDGKINCGLFTFYNENSTEEIKNKYYFKLEFYVYNLKEHERNKKDNNNPIDDIEITYADYNNRLINSSEYLTYGNRVTEEIGNCSN